jgi:aldehyde dehydrogenase (NAD+)
MVAASDYDKETQAALAKTPRKLLIDGQFVDGKAGRTFATIDPSTGKEICKVAEGDAEDIDLAVKAARKAFEGPWRKMAARDRGYLLWKFADLIEREAHDLAIVETLDNGKPVQAAEYGDIKLAVSHIRYFAGWCDKITGSTVETTGGRNELGSPGTFAYTVKEPIGVVGQIVPWNFPILMMVWKIAPALACGNTIVIKIAEQTPLNGLRIGQLALEAGIPAGVLNVIPGFGAKAGAALAAHPDVDKVAFTGSGPVGRLVASAASKNIKPVTLELGGKSPSIVWKDVDVTEAATLSHWALFSNMGQSCVAGSRTFVHEDIYDEFVKKATDLASSRKVGNPLLNGIEQGPIVSKVQFDKVMNYIKAGQDEGATIHTGGKQSGKEGYFVEPTVFSDVEDHFKIAKEEIFGPVQSIFKYSTLDEVIKRANATNYGLGAYLYAKDINVITRLSHAIKAGSVFVNSPGSGDDTLPFGGYKESGVGRDKGEAALHHYTITKTIHQTINLSSKY